MAEINIERSDRRSGIWIVIALLLIALALWWLFSARPFSDSRAGLDDSASTVSEVAGSLAGGVEDSAGAGASRPPAVDTYLRWNDQRRGDSVMTLDHRYTATGIRNLAGALESIARDGQGASVENELRMLRQRADSLEQDPSSTRHADYVRASFQSLAGLMKAMQQASYPDLANDVSAVGNAAEGVRTGRPLLEQRAEVNGFFDAAATAVQRMTDARR